MLLTPVKTSAFRSLKNLCATILLAACSLSAPLFAHAGDLDTKFGTGGATTTTFYAGTNSYWNVALQKDGKIVAVGVAGAGVEGDFALGRYNTNGTPDLTFGTGGVVLTDFGGKGDEAFGIAIQKDGKILAAGSHGDVTTTVAPGVFALARYLPDGSLDPTFGTGGKVTMDFYGAGSAAYALTLLDDGRFLAGGTAVVNGSKQFALARFLPNGSLDTTFGTGGKVTTQFPIANSDIYNIAIQEDGKIVCAGGQGEDIPGNFALARYHKNGALDRSFGDNGIVSTNFDTGTSLAYGLQIQRDGKIVLAGLANGTSNTIFQDSLRVVILD